MSSEVMIQASRSAGRLPVWTSVLAVVAHPDDESFGLGAILDAFTGAGARVEVLCMTHREASTLHGAPGDLASLRGTELSAAADVLGMTHTMLHDHPDGALSEVCQTRLAAEVAAAAGSSHPDGLLVFDTAGVTGHLDHVAATSAAMLTAEMLNLPVLGWTLPGAVAAQLNQELGTSFTGHRVEDIDLRVSVDRARQRLASRAHVSQALPDSVLWRGWSCSPTQRACAGYGRPSARWVARRYLARHPAQGARAAYGGAGQTERQAGAGRARGVGTNGPTRPNLPRGNTGLHPLPALIAVGARTWRRCTAAGSRSQP